MLALVHQIQNGEHEKFASYSEEAKACWAMGTDNDTLLDTLQDIYNGFCDAHLKKVVVLLDREWTRAELLAELDTWICENLEKLWNVGDKRDVRGQGEERTMLEMLWDAHDWANSLLNHLRSIVEDPNTDN